MVPRVAGLTRVYYILVAGMILWITNLFFSSFLRRVFSDHLYFGGWRPREIHVRLGFCFVLVGLTLVFPGRIDISRIDIHSLCHSYFCGTITRISFSFGTTWVKNIITFSGHRNKLRYVVYCTGIDRQDTQDTHEREL